MTDPSLTNMERIMLAYLAERGASDLRSMAGAIGALKERFEREPASIPPGLASLASCVDDVSRTVKKLMDRGLVARAGKTPREWTYSLTDAGKTGEMLPPASRAAMMALLG